MYRDISNVGLDSGVTVDATSLPQIRILLDSADDRMLRSLYLYGDLSEFFIIAPSCLRKKLTLSARDFTTNTTVYNCFAWRMARKLNDVGFPKYLNVPL